MRGRGRHGLPAAAPGQATTPQPPLLLSSQIVKLLCKAFSLAAGRSSVNHWLRAPAPHAPQTAPSASQAPPDTPNAPPTPWGRGGGGEGAPTGGLLGVESGERPAGGGQRAQEYSTSTEDEGGWEPHQKWV